MRVLERIRPVRSRASSGGRIVVNRRNRSSCSMLSITFFDDFAWGRKRTRSHLEQHAGSLWQHLIFGIEENPLAEFLAYAGIAAYSAPG